MGEGDRGRVLLKSTSLPTEVKRKVKTDSTVQWNVRASATAARQLAKRLGKFDAGQIDVAGFLLPPYPSLDRLHAYWY